MSMRIRFRRNVLIKLGLVVLVALFAIPYLVYRLDSSEQKASNKERHKKQRVKDAQIPLLKDGDQNDKENVVANPRDVPTLKEAKAEELGTLPKAKLRKGELGNFEPRNYRPLHGPGENGQAVYTTMEEQARAQQTIREYGFNMVNSDKIAMNRTIPDTRIDECKYWEYPEKLPTASVILVFHNEGWSTLMRTVHSVINMSPPHLLHEVVMVDDFSDKEDLKGQLDEYVKQFHGLVKVYRNKERMGLIGTRTRGADLSKGDVIIFLDAHCECNRNWLVPLLDVIAHDRTTMAVPIVDGVDWDNYRYHPVYGTQHHRGIFEWGFLYKESQVPQIELDRRQHHSEPYRSPTHAGGLFAMDRKYFFEMGAYDPGLKIWGGENFELSFKLWQCGGKVVWVPCSRVGHVYRNHMPYGFGKVESKIPLILLNYMRVVEVWLDDEHKEYFYTREPGVRGYPVGDISKQLQFKKDHNCKSFKWFLDNIAYEVYEKFPPLPPNKAWGEVKRREGGQCMDTLGQGVGGGPIGVSGCHHFGGNQLYRLNAKGQIGTGERCIESPGGDTLHMGFCDTQPEGPWDWNETTGLLRHNQHEKCVKQGDDQRLHLQACNPEVKEQVWDIKEVWQWK